MFYERYLGLCKKKNVSPSKAAVECRFNKGSVSVWKKKYENGEDVKPTLEILMKISNYFDVSVDYLLGKEPTARPHTVDKDTALKYALFGNNSDDITPQMLNDVRRFADFIRKQDSDSK